jgi:hypothetical protein
LNFDFPRKKGNAGEGNSYSNSDIRQERKLALHDDWRPQECDERRLALVSWINTRWGADSVPAIGTVDFIEVVPAEADEDGIVCP